MQVQLTDDWRRIGRNLAAGSVLDTEAPAGSLFTLSRAEAQQLLREGKASRLGGESRRPDPTHPGALAALRGWPARRR